MKNVTFCCLPNHVLDTGNTITAGSQASTDLVPANLRDPVFGRAWRSLYASVASTWVRFQIASGKYREVGAVIVANTNLSTSSINQDTGALTATARWRYRAASVDFKPRVIPDTIAAKSANLSGTIAAFAETDPEHPDATWLTCTDDLANDVRVTFPTLGGLDLLTGAGLQAFRVNVRRKAAGGTDPTIEIQLWESGVLVTSLSTGTAITALAGQVVTATWNASSLAAASGANMEVKILATAGSTTTVEYGAIEAVVEFTNSGGTYYDSGTLTPALPRHLGLSPLNLYHVPATANLLNYHQIDFTDSTNADGYVEAGFLMMGPVIRPDVNVDWGMAWKFDDPSVQTITPGQVIHSELRPKSRIFEGQFGMLSQTEADNLQDRIDRYVGRTGLFGLMEDSDDTARYHLNAGVARLEELEPVPLAHYSNYTRHIVAREAVA